MTPLFKWLPHPEYANKLSFSIVYALLASIAVNFFYQPGNIYSSGITGVAQIITTISREGLGFYIPLSLALLLLNVPLFFLGWFKIGHKFTIFTGITVLLTSLFVQILPEETVTTDPMICAIFGGAINGVGIGYALKNLPEGWILSALPSANGQGRRSARYRFSLTLLFCSPPESCLAGNMRCIVRSRFLSVEK